MSEDIFPELAVKIKVTGTKVCGGSGFLFQSNNKDYTYVLTAKHCLIGVDFEDQNIFSINDIVIERDGICNNEKLEAVKYIFSESEMPDIAIILVKKVQNLSNILTGLANSNKKLKCYGYPNIYSTDEFQGLINEAKCRNRHPISKRFVIKLDDSISDIDNSAYENINGYSGSAVYSIQKAGILIVGIIAQLRNPSGAYSEVTVECISKFNELLLENALDSLEPECLRDFEGYFNKAFSGFNNDTIHIKRKFLEAISNEVTPYKIKNIFKERLILPRNAYNEHSIVEEELWKGWVILLTSLSYDKGFKLNDELLISRSFLFKILSGKKIPLHYYFVKNLYNYEECIRNIITDTTVYDDIQKDGTVIVYNSNPSDFRARRLEFGAIRRIVSDISGVKPTDGRIDIDNPEIDKNISIFHLKEIKDVFANQDYKKSENLIEEEIKLALEGVYKNARKT